MTQYIKIDDTGSKFWYKDKEMTILHREDGPAVEWENVYKAWWINGKLHREDGPAIKYADGYKEWYLNGVALSEDEFNIRMNPAQELTIAEIERLLGYRVKVVK